MKNLVITLVLIVVTVAMSSCSSDIEPSVNDMGGEEQLLIGHVSRGISCEILNGVLAKKHN